ncbi:MAG: hypothetical protein WAS33_24940, partial [Candidatus Promineifilaceae bacterium]
MYREIGRAAIAHNKRIIAHATLDTALNILSYSPELQKWSCLKPGTLVGTNLFTLFPHLAAQRDYLLEQMEFSDNFFTYQHARFAQNPYPDQIFDLQLERFPELDNRLLLTIIPVFSSSRPQDQDKNLVLLTRHNRELLLLNRAS